MDLRHRWGVVAPIVTGRGLGVKTGVVNDPDRTTGKFAVTGGNGPGLAIGRRLSAIAGLVVHQISVNFRRFDRELRHEQREAFRPGEEGVAQDQFGGQRVGALAEQIVAGQREKGVGLAKAIDCPVAAVDKSDVACSRQGHGAAEVAGFAVVQKAAVMVPGKQGRRATAAGVVDPEKDGAIQVVHRFRAECVDVAVRGLKHLIQAIQAEDLGFPSHQQRGVEANDPRGKVAAVIADGQDVAVGCPGQVDIAELRRLADAIDEIAAGVGLIDDPRVAGLPGDKEIGIRQHQDVVVEMLTGGAEELFFGVNGAVGPQLVDHDIYLAQESMKPHRQEITGGAAIDARERFGAGPVEFLDALKHATGVDLADQALVAAVEGEGETHQMQVASGRIDDSVRPARGERQYARPLPGARAEDAGDGRRSVVGA